MLGDWGMQVTLAEDGRRALELLDAPGAGAAPFDLALVDMHMPRLDGLGLARALTESGRHPGLKLVLLVLGVQPGRRPGGARSGIPALRGQAGPAGRVATSAARRDILTPRGTAARHAPRAKGSGCRRQYRQPGSHRADAAATRLQGHGGFRGFGRVAGAVRAEFRSGLDGHPDAGHGRRGGVAHVSPRAGCAACIPHAARHAGGGRHGQRPGR